MPLSEHEQRILHELEQALFNEDPQFADRVQSETVYSHAGRYLKWSIVLFLLGLGIVIGTFTFSVPLAFFGFVVMLGSAVSIEANLRRMGKAGIRDISQALRGEVENKKITNLRDKFKNRFRQEDN
ncbi:MAG: DUF3040 domain-containing protein [Actinobacteria bacterium]|nr:DUF3040 domain-containing protein [Actinomycetota bacterium]MCL5446071.1 DUF3040 domain-containing protein [Actinomycetota bacterium]